ncbi:4Fe-4S dicluster domain-containing protein [Solwaraspora sp. WMMB335]|uniref:4Fe-4S dicluster domain-containing protein n=1 Tax=Solwaraspora sp. WMMB335 TaxID=3404118 RepID=UPI003B951FBD
MAPRVNESLCSLCGICQDVCPGDILHIDRGVSELVRYPDECSYCDVCRVECPAGAIEIEFTWSMRQQPISILPGRPDDD